MAVVRSRGSELSTRSRDISAASGSDLVRGAPLVPETTAAAIEMRTARIVSFVCLRGARRPIGRHCPAFAFGSLSPLSRRASADVVDVV